MLLVVSSAFWLLFSHFSVDTTDGLRQVESELSSGKYEQAIAGCDKLLTRSPGLTDALIVKGESLQRLNRIDEALQVYSQIPDNDAEHSVSARLTEASIFLQRGNIVAAQQRLELVESISPSEPLLGPLMMNALTAAGRRWESMPYLRNSLAEEVGDTLTNLIYLAVPDQMPQPNEAFLATVINRKDSLGALGAARVAMALGEVDRAIIFLEHCRVNHPELAEARLQYATLMLNENRQKEFRKIISENTAAMTDHPDYWLLCGREAQESGNPKVAIRCYWEVLRRYPNQDRACYQLGQLLAAEGRSEESRLFIERAGRLAQLVEKATVLYNRVDDTEAMSVCAEMTLALGRYRESRHWCNLMLMFEPPPKETGLFLKQLNELGDRGQLWQDDELDLAQRFRFEDYPLPAFPSPEQTTDQGGTTSSELADSLSSQQGTEFPIRFVDDSVVTGLDFTYRNGSDASTEGRRMFEYTGGGVAAIDLDLDGFFDVHMTQGTDWPPSPDQTEFLDRCFRNIRGRCFQNVAAVSGLDDRGFGQGVAVGDFDNDGFPDLYVGNLNGNRLYRNNGDGTFDDATRGSGLGHRYWTTSCAIADLNGDSLPDLYDVTFLQGEHVFTQICKGSDGIPRSCAPAGFDAAPDFVWENLGDGTFRQFPADSGFDVPDGDGLGIVVANFDRSGNLGIFIANDGRANFFFTPRMEQGRILGWQETGVINGTAFDALGQAQACMGVASGDFDHDGLPDLFVTNFYQEANTLYVNMGSNAFLDQSRRYGLHDPGYAYLGFGTQFLDADLDSWPDLAVANGHVDDFSHKDIPFRMRPQFFRNRAGDRFNEIPQTSIGVYFTSEHLGRGLAVLDWNRDFLADFVVSQLDEPSALLTNTSPSRGSGTGLSLRAVNGARDAIGAVVVAETGDQSVHYQITAGDGYQSANSREIILATPMDCPAFTIRIQWRSGAEQTFEDVRPGRHYVAIEGHADLADCH